MSTAEANVTLDTMKLQPPLKGTDSSKYLSESLSKVEAFQNKIVKQGTSEDIIEFVLDKQGYDNLMINAVPQAGSKGVNAVKFHYEGLSRSHSPEWECISISTVKAIVNKRDKRKRKRFI